VLGLWILLLAGLCQNAAVPPPAVHLALPDGAWIHPDQAFVIETSRPLADNEGRLAVLIRDVDWSAFFTADGTHYRLERGSLPLRLPSGAVDVHVFLVTGANNWQSIGDLTVHVTTPAGFEQATLAPRIDLTNKGQVAEGHTPASAAPTRSTFQDVTVNVGLRSQHARGGVNLSTQVNTIGVSNQPEALRFGTNGATAPKFDLADYAVAIESRRAKLAFGQLTFSPERHLITGFNSRGVSVIARLPRVDLTIAGLNGNTIVGFDNLFGLSTRTNRVALAVLGAELARQAGVARLEASFVDGSRLPKAGFTQALVNDAEKSRGEGLRFVGHDLTQRVRVDAGFARSQLTNPADPLLAQGQTLVPIREQTSEAAYVDTSVDIVKGAHIGKDTLARLTGAYRFERIDPLFRSVGAVQGSRADLLQHVAELNGGLGVLSAQASQTWSHDNLGHVASLLRTDTGVTSANVSLPMSAMTKSTHAAWLPTLAYVINRVRQIGVGTPVDGGFISASQIPNQVSTTQSARADWNFTHWRIGYSVNRAFQDNRQTDRQTADFINTVQGLSLGLTRRAFDLSTDIGLERATNRELAHISRTRRIGLTGNWRITPRSTLNAIVSRSILDDPGTSFNAIADANLQFTQSIAPPRRVSKHATLQLFGRGSWQSADLTTLLLGLDLQRRRTWSIATGLSLSVF
jgi:hypothetical protein